MQNVTIIPIGDCKCQKCCVQIKYIEPKVRNLASKVCLEWHTAGLILGLHPANERRRYFVMTSLIGWAQAYKQPWHNSTYKQRVLMHRHQGLNVRHGLCHIYMRYLYIYELFIAFVCFVVTWWYICGVLCGKWQARESTGMFGNLMAIYYIMPQFIQNHSRFVMLMKTCMIS